MTILAWALHKQPAKKDLAQSVVSAGHRTASGDLFATKKWLRASDVSALSEARLHDEGGGVRRASGRAFDKAVRRKPLAVAADAGLMQIEWSEGDGCK